MPKTATSSLPLGLPPLQFLIYGYFAVLLVGFGLLCTPWAEVSDVAALDHFFIATSALSTTGLATIGVGQDYTAFGQAVVLVLIQIGGLGYMSLGSFVVLMRKRELTTGTNELLAYDFSLPEGFDLTHFIRRLVLFTVGAEVVGALLLTWIFAARGEEQAVWNGVFHSISAFCTAGFSLFASGFEGYRDHFGLNVVISVLATLGALGFIVVADFFSRFGPERRALTFTSRIILRFTAAGIALGTVVLFLSDPTIEALPAERGLLAAFFQSMTAFTTVGFNTVPIGGIAAAPLFVVVMLMIVGASPSGTGGGMKSTTFTALWAQLKSTFAGQSRTLYMNRVVPDHRVRAAVSNFFFYVLVLIGGIYALLLVQDEDPFAVIFEAVSALGTVGLSVGLTGALTPLGKVIVCVLMFLGRVGPLSAGLVLFGEEEIEAEPIEEDLAI